MYWRGRGVIRISKKDYYAGEKVPVDLLTKEKIATLKKKKELADEPFEKTRPKVKHEGPKK